MVRTLGVGVVAMASLKDMRRNELRLDRRNGQLVES